MKPSRQSGFTLIELIITIVLSAIALAAVLPLLRSAFLRSYEPRIQLHEGFALQSAMEELVAMNTNTLADLKTYVDNNPDLQTRFTVLYNNYVSFTSTSGGQEIPGGGNPLLKVTLQNNLGETATRLFTEPL